MQEVSPTSVLCILNRRDQSWMVSFNDQIFTFQWRDEKDKGADKKDINIKLLHNGDIGW